VSNSVFPTLAGSLMEVDREPMYSTIVQRESGGRELRVNTQTAARYRYRISYDFLRQDAGGDEAATLQAFFSTHRGSWDSFFFTDPYNSAVTTRNFGTGDGTTTIFTLKDEMGERVAGTTGTVLIYKDAVLQTVTTHYTLDVNTGVVTFLTAPANGLALTWTGSFYRRVRFADDGLQLTRRFSRVWRGGVTLVSVLP
jgi:uncharacterized protein (TIGR02217 family)